MNHGQVDAACDLFRRSLELKRAAGAQLNLARCEEELNRLPQALTLYEELHEELPSDDPRVAIIEQRMRLLETRVARITLVLDSGSPHGAVANDRNGRFPLNETRLLMPGEYRVTISAPGYRSMPYVLQLDPAEARTVRVAPGPRLESAATEHDEASRDTALATAVPQSSKPVHPEPSDSPSIDRNGSVSPLTYGVLAVGGVSLVVSGIAGLVVLQQNAIVESECTQPDGGGLPECPHRGVVAADRGRLYANIATASFVVGVAGIAGGTYLLVHGARGGPQAGWSASLAGHF